MVERGLAVFRTGQADMNSLLVGLPGADEIDSLAVEQSGSVCVGTLVHGAITVISPDGSSVERHWPPPGLEDGAITNICFGGPDLQAAYITLSQTGKLISCRWPRPGLALAFPALSAPSQDRERWVDGDSEGNLALVTGAGRNLGAAIADELAQQGAAIVVADVDMSMAVGTAERLVADGFKAWAEEIDVTDRQALDELLRRTVDQHGHVSIVVNNAGGADMAAIDAGNAPVAWDRTIAVNLTGAFNVTRAFLPSLSRTHGNVVNLSSVARFTSGTTNAAYSASKGGIRSLTKKLARDLAPHGVRVNAVAPGYMNTPKPGKVGSNP
jgi:NAD(P)-dependent dehydrogenase (short-subunit alcohol dehydrogenase family)